MDIKTYLARFNWDEVKERIYAVNTEDVKAVLCKKKLSVDDFLVLLSPASACFLEEMALMSQHITQNRFGKNIQLFMPLYLSNECQNICTYCGFSLDNKIKRKTLSHAEIVIEALTLKKMGIDHVLLVTGEANSTVHIDYFLKAIALLKSYFNTISIEVQPLEEEEYKLLYEAGVYSVLVYQETYHREVYKKYHLKGKKTNFDYRLATSDRIGRARIHKIGVGVLLGLEDWRVDSFYNALHIDYLQKMYWQSKYAVSFPRLRPAEGEFVPNFILSDSNLLQLICAYRIWNPELDISISTRESELFRNHVVSLGATTMSAASKTNPGGYAVDLQSLEQFEISDERSVEDFVAMITAKGYECVVKDWDTIYKGVKQ